MSGFPYAIHFIPERALRPNESPEAFIERTQPKEHHGFVALGTPLYLEIFDIAMAATSAQALITVVNRERGVVRIKHGGDRRTPSLLAHVRFEVEAKAIAHVPDEEPLTYERLCAQMAIDPAKAAPIPWRNLKQGTKGVLRPGEELPAEPDASIEVQRPEPPTPSDIEKMNAHPDVIAFRERHKA